MTVEKHSSIDEKQKALVESFEFLEDWTDRYEHIINLGKELAPLPAEFKTSANLIKGCQSQVWLHAEMKNGRLYFSADSDAIITKGLISMIIQVYSGHSAMEIINTDLTFIDRIGLKEHLSPTRSNGLLSMVKQLKFYAIAFSAKS
jgi:cysteine desulfuration protein SufE